MDQNPNLDQNPETGSKSNNWIRNPEIGSKSKKWIRIQKMDQKSKNGSEIQKLDQKSSMDQNPENNYKKIPVNHYQIKIKITLKSNKKS